MESLTIPGNLTAIEYTYYSELGRSDLNLQTWYRARLVVQGSRVEGYVGHLDGTHLDTPLFSFDIPPEYAYTGPIALKAIGGATNRYDNVRVETIPEPLVAGRHAFYNNSAFDSVAHLTDDDAVARDKHALLPGETASFENYTSYGKGINGVMVDVNYLTGTPTAEDFFFKIGNDNNPDGWAEAPAPAELTVRPGEGVDGSDRITIIWPDNAIERQWLQVTVLATENTGLPQPDIFYFGNAIGETGNSAGDAKVDAIDMLGARDNPRDYLDPAPIDFRLDFDRDGRVNAVDMLIARDNPTHYLNSLQLITVPGGKSVVPEPSTVILLGALAAGLLAYASPRSLERAIK